MKTQRNPKYDWGQRVIANVPLFNDGSLPERDDDALVIDRGTFGEVVRVGMYVEADIPVYAVAFQGGMVVGCLENELVSA